LRFLSSASPLYALDLNCAYPIVSVHPTNQSSDHAIIYLTTTHHLSNQPIIITIPTTHYSHQSLSTPIIINANHYQDQSLSTPIIISTNRSFQSFLPIVPSNRSFQSFLPIRYGLGNRFLFVALDKRAAAIACTLSAANRAARAPRVAPGVALLDEATYPPLKVRLAYEKKIED